MFVLILDSVDDFHTVEVRRLHRIFGGLEAVGVGVTHISHIETGNSIPSLQVMLDIINALGCSADELFCMEIDQARPLMNSWLSELVADCSNMEIKLITDMVLSLKSSLRRLRLDDPT